MSTKCLHELCLFLSLPGVLHTGIFDLLAELKDVPLLRNLPSDNIDRGLWSSKELDEDTMRGIEESTKTKAKVVGGSVFGSGQAHGREEGRLQIEIQSSETSTSNASEEPAEKRIKTETNNGHDEDDVAWED